MGEPLLRSRSRLEQRFWTAFALAVVVVAGGAFWSAGLCATAGVFPAPLDDVYIHYAFARSFALGHPFEWSPGNGYSSGNTSLLYPIMLAPAWWVGLRGPALGWAAAALACAALFDLCRSIRALLGRAPRAAAWAVPPLVVSVPLLDWSWFSGMETALLGAVLGRALVAVEAVARQDDPRARARLQLRAGFWLAALPATRPETIALAAPLAVAVAHAGRSLGAIASLARGGGPTLALVATHAAINHAMTGELAAAGAVRKLLVYHPYAAPADLATEVLKNLVVLRVQAFDVALGGRPWAWALPLLALAAVVSRYQRRLAVALLAGAAGALLLVSLNATACFSNLRYAAPILAMLLAAGALGAFALARRGRVGRTAAAVLLAAALLGPARHFPAQVDHFARASANIAGQQVEVARRIAALAPRRVLVNDAGAIPYVSGVAAIDGLGLGGFRRLPFARASVHGVPAVVELLERLPEEDRPDAMALYPDWWHGLADVFGKPIDRVRIADNVICAADEKVILSADWSLLAPPLEAREGAVDEVDVADLVDERAHAYEGVGVAAGWVIASTHRLVDGRLRWDAGRIVPAGHREAFDIDAGVARAPSTLVLRTDATGGAKLRVRVIPSGGTPGDEREIDVPDASGAAASPDAAWREVSFDAGALGGKDRIEIDVVSGTWRSFHAWVVR